MQAQKTLIDKAAKICGSDAELCRRAQISPALLSLMRSGKRAMTPVTAAVLADIAGENAREVALDAVIESAKGTRLESAIREILGKALAAGVAAMLVFSYSGGSHDATKTIAKLVNRLYIVSNTVIRSVASAVRMAWVAGRAALASRHPGHAPTLSTLALA